MLLPVFPLVGLLLLLVTACVVLWAARQLITVWGVGDPWATTLHVLLVLLVVLWGIRLIWPGSL